MQHGHAHAQHDQMAPQPQQLGPQPLDDVAEDHRHDRQRQRDMLLGKNSSAKRLSAEFHQHLERVMERFGAFRAGPEYPLRSNCAVFK